MARLVARTRSEDGGLFAEGDLIFLQLLQKNEMNTLKRLAREVSLYLFYNHRDRLTKCSKVSRKMFKSPQQNSQKLFAKFSILPQKMPGRSRA